MEAKLGKYPTVETPCQRGGICGDVCGTAFGASYDVIPTGIEPLSEEIGRNGNECAVAGLLFEAGSNPQGISSEMKNIFCPVLGKIGSIKAQRNGLERERELVEQVRVAYSLPPRRDDLTLTTAIDYSD